MSRLRKDRKISEGIRQRLRYETENGKLFWVDGRNKGKESGWTDQYGYRLTRFEGQLLRNHHIVWYLHHGIWPTSEIDHRDNDPSNNRIENLRLADRFGQGANQILQVRREGCYKGVYKVGKRWNAKIKHKQKSKHLGMFDTAEEAAKAYNEAAKEMFGDYANLNEIKEAA